MRRKYIYTHVYISEGQRHFLLPLVSPTLARAVASRKQAPCHFLTNFLTEAFLELDGDFPLLIRFNFSDSHKNT